MHVSASWALLQYTTVQYVTKATWELALAANCGACCQIQCRNIEI